MIITDFFTKIKFCLSKNNLLNDLSGSMVFFKEYMMSSGQHL